MTSTRTTPGRDRRARYATGAWLLALLAAPALMASEILYLARNEQICDPSQDACVQGTLTYEVNPRLLWLSGRVESAPGPGMLQIILKGTTRLGYVRYAPMEITLRGKHSEIVDFRMIPDHPDVANWKIDSITFVPDPAR